MSPQEIKHIQYHASKGDASAMRLLGLLGAMENATDLLNGIATARGMVGEHNDIYGQAIDGMMAIIIPAILTAMDTQTKDEFFEAVVWYIPKEKGGEGY